MAGEASFMPSEADAVAAGRDSFSRFLRQPYQWRAMLGLGAVAGLVGLAIATSGSSSLEGLLWICLWSVLGGALLVPLILLVRYTLVAGTARRLFRQDKGVQVAHVFRWTDEGLAFRSSAGEGRIAWPDLYRWSEGQRTFLFWTTERTCFYLPRHCLDPVRAGDLRRTLACFGPPYF